jgi:hypothetical protein
MQGDSSIRGNNILNHTNESLGGGVWMSSGSFEMQNSAKIKGNTAGQGGGVHFNSSFTMSNETSVEGNSAHAPGGGGGVYNNGGTFIMQGDASVTGNKAITIGEQGAGGGVVIFHGKFEMWDNASVSYNEANFTGGVSINSGEFEMREHASVSSNTADREAGGVSLSGDGAIFRMHDFTSIFGNSAASGATGGGGVSVDIGTSFFITGGIIYGADENDDNLKNIFNGSAGRDALHNGGTAVYGSASNWTDLLEPTINLNNTTYVVDGELLPWPPQ